MLAISDVNSAGRPPFLRVPPPTQWHTNHAPSLSPIIKPADPFFHPPWIIKAPLFLIKNRGGAKRPFEVAKAYATVRKKYVEVTKSLSRTIKKGAKVTK